MQVIFLNSKGLWSAAGVPPAGRACTGESSSQQWDLLQAALKCKPPRNQRQQQWDRALAAAHPVSQECRDPRALTQLNWGPWDHSPAQQNFFTSDCMQHCRMVSTETVLSQINFEIKYYCSSNLLKVDFHPIILPGFSSFQPTPLLEGVQGGIGTMTPSLWWSPTLKCLSLQSNSSHTGGGKPCETLRHT